MITTSLAPKLAEGERHTQSIQTGTIAFKSPAPKDAAVVPPSADETVKQNSTSEQPLVEATPKDEQLSPKFAELARKEKALRLQHQKIQEEKAALKAKEAEYQTSYVSKDQLRAKMAEDPLGALAEFGVSQEQLLNLALNGPSPQNQEIKVLKSELLELKNLLQQNQTKSEERQTQAYEQAVKDLRRDTKLLVDSDEKFETIKDTNSIDAVVDLITETHAKDGILLSVEEAANEIENYLVEEGLRFASLKKIKQKLTPPQAPEAQKPQITEKPQTKTLTNSQVATSPGKLTERERVERAKLAFRGQLQSS